MSKNRQVIYVDAGPILSDKLSGIGHLTLQMIKGLLEHDAEFDVRLLVPINKVPYVDKWGISQAKIVKVPLPARIWNRIPSIPFMPPIDIFLKKGVFIFPNFKAYRLIRMKSLTYVHDISFELFPQFTEPKNLKMLKRHVPRWIKRTSLVVTDSQSSKAEIVKQYGLPQDKVGVVYCGVDMMLFNEQSRDTVSDVLKKYQITTPYLMFLSSIEPRKNVERLLGSLETLPPAYKSEYSLLLVGGMGWQNDRIYKKIEHLRTEGWKILKPESYVPDEDIPVLLTGASMLLHPALHEGFGIPVIESMACGTPVITSDIPVMREVGGDAALFVDPLSEESIAQAIERLANDASLVDDLKSKGLKRAGNFTWERSTEDLIQLIQSVNTGIIK